MEPYSLCERALGLRVAKRDLHLNVVLKSLAAGPSLTSNACTLNSVTRAAHGGRDGEHVVARTGATVQLEQKDAQRRQSSGQRV